MSDEQYRIPRHLDAPPLALWVEVDTAAIGGAGFYLGLIFGGSFLQIAGYTALSLVIARYYARIKMEGGRGVLVQAAYWYLPGSSKFPVPNDVREYIG